MDEGAEGCCENQSFRRLLRAWRPDKFWAVMCVFVYLFLIGRQMCGKMFISDLQLCTSQNIRKQERNTPSRYHICRASAELEIIKCKILTGAGERRVDLRRKAFAGRRNIYTEGFSLFRTACYWNFFRRFQFSSWSCSRSFFATRSSSSARKFLNLLQSFIL